MAILLLKNLEKYIPAIVYNWGWLESEFQKNLYVVYLLTLKHSSKDLKVTQFQHKML